MENKLTQQLTALREHLAGLNLSDIVSSGVVSLCAARAIGYALPLPTTIVDGPSSRYDKYTAPAVKELVAQVNEEFLLDMPTVLTHIKSIWMLRYSLVFDPTSEEVVKFLDRIALQQLDPSVSKAVEDTLSKVQIDFVTNAISAGIELKAEVNEVE